MSDWQCSTDETQPPLVDELYRTWINYDTSECIVDNIYSLIEIQCIAERKSSSGVFYRTVSLPLLPLQSFFKKLVSRCGHLPTPNRDRSEWTKISPDSLPSWAPAYTILPARLAHFEHPAGVQCWQDWWSWLGQWESVFQVKRDNIKHAFIGVC